ncbi:acyl-CoA:6-aminopenicillanic acid acyl transferase [Nonomuraea fuscirosea]|uniref:Acyl-CoA:6-aminopenicillanic acid acyl transferase n=1 Tax=Nonomuraea fuscirosea TaxID=1291556 RepID=A0A2T0NAQ2_9ACTN|nr:C45 family peptidase [Nonomuraea fuscirosea]PRX70043.1 acyl-CoA:6-aminopenicillanic acid acyl transferase [Nonomuraea fuscirosea]
MKNLTHVAGGKNDFQLVRHLTLAGGQVEIGRALAEEARRLGWAPTPIDPVVGRARRTWFERHWPQHHARMDGAAAALGLDPDQDELALDALAFVPEGSGCSAMWIPPSAAADGHGRAGRNYDFFPTTTSEIMGGTPGPGELPMASRPYVITTLPDEGLASVVLTMNELDGCMDGINAAGLAVMLLVADFEHAEPPKGPATPQVGLASVQLPRFLVDTCANADQAKQALLGAKHYDFGVALHYLVADAYGQAFVWERGTDGSEHVIDLGDAPLCVTNHLLHRHPDPARLPADGPHSFGTFGRLRTLYDRASSVMTAEDVRDGMDAVRQPETGDLPFRTLWTTVFDTAARTLSARFYLGDGGRYSEELVFSADGSAR